MRQGWQSVYDFISDFIIPVVVALSVIGALGYFSWPYLSQLLESTEQRRAEQGRHYLTDCQVTEKNVDRGFWSERENILQCGPTREYVSVSEYERAVGAWYDAQPAPASPLTTPGKE
ncbi:hypothetical protein [Providencia rettgeri]|uniref:hypothetical protein n=1 Tax=Providencia rettgeri TaxID=587 RepID=UPI0030183E7A